MFFVFKNDFFSFFHLHAYFLLQLYLHLCIRLLFLSLLHLPDGNLAIMTRRTTEDVAILKRAECLNAV